MGAPFTPEQIAHRIAVLQKHGGDLKAAAAELRIKPESLREWRSRLPEWRVPKSVGAIVSSRAVPEEPLAERQARRFKDEIARLKRELDQANRELNDAEDLRHAVFGLAKPIAPADHRINPSPRQATAEAALLFQSDEQWGEVVAPEEVGGLNAYNKHIAAARLKRLIETTIRCCQPPHAPAPPPVLYYCMGADIPTPILAKLRNLFSGRHDATQ